MTPNFLKQIVEFFGKKLDHVGVEIKGAELVTIKGIQGDKGDKGDKGDSGKDGRDGKDGKDSKIAGTKGEQGIPGKDGKNGVDGKNGKDGKNGVDGKNAVNGKDGSPDTGEAIIQKINEDKSNKLIRKGKIEGFDEFETRIKTAEVNSQWRGGGSFVYDYELNSLLNGVTKTFSIPQNAKIIAVFGSSFPTVFSKNTDYTFTASTITFTSQIDAASTLATGQTVVILYKIL